MNTENNIPPKTQSLTKGGLEALIKDIRDFGKGIDDYRADIIAILEYIREHNYYSGGHIVFDNRSIPDEDRIRQLVVNLIKYHKDTYHSTIKEQTETRLFMHIWRDHYLKIERGKIAILF